MQIITIIIQGGLIADITGIQKGTQVKVRDYDVENYDLGNPNIHTDKDGDEYHLSTWTHNMRTYVVHVDKQGREVSKELVRK